MPGKVDKVVKKSKAGVEAKGGKKSKAGGDDKAVKKSKGAEKPAGKDPKKPKASKGKDGAGKGGKSKGKKGKKKGKKKKGPRCPIQRFKKPLKNVCTENEHPTAVLNSYFVCHGVLEMLKFRKFIWKKKQKPIPPLEPEPKFNDKPWGF